MTAEYGNSTAARQVAQRQMGAAIAKMREIADEMEAYLQSDTLLLTQHGDEYAQSAGTKATMVNRCKDANRDLSRAQDNMFEAVAAAVSA